MNWSFPRAPPIESLGFHVPFSEIECGISRIHAIFQKSKLRVHIHTLKKQNPNHRFNPSRPHSLKRNSWEQKLHHQCPRCCPISWPRGFKKAFRNTPGTTKTRKKTKAWAIRWPMQRVQVDPKSAHGTPRPTQVHLKTAPTFAFNTELLRSFSKNPPREPRRPSEDLSADTSDVAQV